MAIDTSIYGQLQPPAQVNPLAQLGQIAQLQAAQYALGKAQREDEMQNRLLSTVGSPRFSQMDTAGKVNALQSMGAFDQAGKLATSTAAANKDQREAEFKQFELGAKRLEVVGGAMSHLAQNPQDAPMVLQQLVQSQVIAPDYAQKIMQGASQAPDPRQFFTAGANAAVSAKDQMAQKLQAAQFGETQRHNMAAEGNAAGNLAVAQGNLAETQRHHAADEGIQATGKTIAQTGQNMNAEMKLADDYRTQSKNFKEVADAYRTITSTLDKATTSPAATLAGATKFMKLLDPGSVVRESELGMALAASGVFDRALNYVNVLQSGRVLTANQVADFKNITNQIYAAARQGQDAVDADYRDKAQRYGLNPDNVVQDLGPKTSNNTATPRSKAEFDSLPSGAIFKAPDGTMRRKP